MNELLQQLPSELRDHINDYGMISITSDQELYNAIKRFNPNFSLQMSYQAIMSNRRRYEIMSKKNTNSFYSRYEDVMMLYNQLSDIDYIIQYTDDDDETGYKNSSYLIYSDRLSDLNEIISNYLGEPNYIYDSNMTYMGFVEYNINDSNDPDLLTSILHGLMLYTSYNEKGIIYKNEFGQLIFDINTPEISYSDTYNETLIQNMNDDGIKLYDIALEQQSNYSLTKYIDDKTKNYIDTNRYNIVNVSYKLNEIRIFTVNDESYIVSGNIDVFRGIVSYLHHPMNIIIENNRDVTHNNRAYKYYTLDNVNKAIV